MSLVIAVVIFLTSKRHLWRVKRGFSWRRRSLLTVTDMYCAFTETDVSLMDEVMTQVDCAAVQERTPQSRRGRARRKEEVLRLHPAIYTLTLTLSNCLFTESVIPPLSEGEAQVSRGSGKGKGRGTLTIVQKLTLTFPNIFLAQI